MSEDLPGPPEATATVGVGQATEYRGNTSDVIAFTAAVSGLTLCGYLATNGLTCCLNFALGNDVLDIAQSAGDP
ncbi:MAG: hypothetical protein Q7U96_06410, partial [Chloroflexota bacterium]|nr:hypothetical protein [Chloroflexota bacterium]